MTTRGKVTVAAFCAFLVGAVPPALIIWNPGNWEWGNHLLGRHEMHATPSAGRGGEAQLARPVQLMNARSSRENRSP